MDIPYGSRRELTTDFEHRVSGLFQEGNESGLEVAPIMPKVSEIMGEGNDGLDARIPGKRKESQVAGGTRIVDGEDLRLSPTGGGRGEVVLLLRNSLDWGRRGGWKHLLK